MNATVAVMFEASGIVRDALIAIGIEAISIDKRPTQRPGPHIEGDVFDHLNDGWTGAIMHPDCTFLCSSGLHWNGRTPGRDAQTEAALNDVRRLMASPISRWAIENPMGRIGTAIRPADQIIQPYMFGEDASKATCLWTKGLPVLKATKRFNGRWVRDKKTGKTVERWSNQTDSGQNKLAPSDDRWSVRSQTYVGIAQAIANQWGPLLASPGEPTDLFEAAGDAA